MEDRKGKELVEVQEVVQLCIKPIEYIARGHVCVCVLSI